MGKGMSLSQVRMKHRRAGRTDVESLREDTEDFLSEYEPSDSIKYGEDYELEILSDVWAFVAENIEREEWKSYTREDWEELERNYVERATYTKPDLFDDILTQYENGELTGDEAMIKANEYQECEYRFCLNVFKKKRKDQKYCPASNCRALEYKARERFKETGTYLPPHVYKDNRYDTDEKNYENNEIAFDMEENIEMFERFQHKDEYGGKRDRVREDFYEISKKIEENIEESPVKRYWIPVTNEGKRSVI